VHVVELASNGICHRGGQKRPVLAENDCRQLDRSNENDFWGEEANEGAHLFLVAGSSSDTEGAEKGQRAGKQG